MNQPFQESPRPSASSDARAAGVYFPAACGRASAVPSAVVVVLGCRRTPERPEVGS
jgi:hypothetical protein